MSKFNKEAIKSFGYDIFSSSFENLSIKFGKTNSYMKLRRDEFEVLKDSPHKGWYNRSPAAGVMLMHNDLKNHTVEESTFILQYLLTDNDTLYIAPILTARDSKILTGFTEAEIEHTLNSKDKKSDKIKKIGNVDVRIFDSNILKL